MVDWDSFCASFYPAFPFHERKESVCVSFARARIPLSTVVAGSPSLGRFSAVSFGSRVYRRCLAGAYPVASVGCARSGSRVLFLSERTGWSEEYPTVGARLFLASPGPDSTVAPGVKSVLEPFERGPAHEESSRWPSHWKTRSPMRVPDERARGCSRTGGRNVSWVYRSLRKGVRRSRWPFHFSR